MESSVKKVFGERFYKLVEDRQRDARFALDDPRKIKFKDLAEELGKTVGALSAYRNGDYLPDIETLIAIADKYDVSIDYLFGRTDVRKPDTDLQAICAYTGLTEEVATILHEKVAKAQAENPDLAEKITAQHFLFFLNAFAYSNELFDIVRLSVFSGLNDKTIEQSSIPSQELDVDPNYTIKAFCREGVRNRIQKLISQFCEKINI